MPRALLAFSSQAHHAALRRSALSRNIRNYVYQCCDVCL